MSSGRQRLGIALAAAGALALAAAPAWSEAPTRASLNAAIKSPRIPAEESWVWRLSIRGLPVGSLVAASGRPGKVDGRRVIISQFQVKTSGLAAVVSGVDDAFTTHVDLDTGLPLQQRTDVAKGKWREVDFHGGGSFDIVRYHEFEKEPVRRQTLPRAAHPYDFTTLVHAMRSLDQPGKRYSLLFYASTRIWKTELTVVGRETVSTPLGRRRAVRIEGRMKRTGRDFKIDSAKERRFVAWISDDKNRVLLEMKAKTEYGDLRLSLMEYRQRGTHLVARQ